MKINEEKSFFREPKKDPTTSSFFNNKNIFKEEKKDN